MRTVAGCCSVSTGSSVVTTDHIPPPVAPDPAPAVLLREQLAEARAAGVTFEDAWPDALAAAVEGLPGRGRERDWIGVLAGLRSTWEAAFERRPAAAAFRLAQTLDVAPGD
jgi:hypothetical protein